MSYIPTAIEATAYEALALLLPSATIIYADQGGPRPTSGTFVTFKVDSARSRGLRSFELTDEAGGSPGQCLQTVGRHRDAGLRVQAYGPEAFGTLTQLEAAVDDPEFTWQLNELGLAFGETAGTRRIQLALKTETEDRAVLDYTIRYYEAQQRDAPALAEAIGAGTFDGEAQPPLVVTFDPS